jgi:hypothetical protein
MRFHFPNPFSRVFLVPLLCLSGILSSCSGVGILGTKQHVYSIRPSRVVWIQVPGLKVEHFSMLFFNDIPKGHDYFFNRASCLGKMWNYNLFQVRPSPEASFLSQTTGTKNIVGQCQDYSKKPVWNYFQKIGFSFGSFQAGNKDKLYSSQVCQENIKEFQKDGVIWKMSSPPSKEANTFHYQTLKQYKKGHSYYDLTCQKDGCFSGPLSNIKHIYNNFTKNNSQTFFVYRDDMYFEHLKKRNVHKARERLVELDKIINFFLDDEKLAPKTLVLLTSAATKNVEFPKRGVDWKKFEKNGKNVLYKRQSLLSFALSFGPGSENFCGIYPESDVFRRVLWSSKDSKLKTLLNGILNGENK